MKIYLFMLDGGDLVEIEAVTFAQAEALLYKEYPNDAEEAVLANDPDKPGKLASSYNAKVCPDCGEHQLSQYQIQHGYHCDHCTREADPEGYSRECMGYNDEPPEPQDSYDY